MKGGGPHKLRFSKLSLYLIALLCVSLAICAWERVPLLTTFIPPSDQLDISFSLPTSVESHTTRTEYTNKQSSIVDVPVDSSTEDFPSDLSTNEITSQPSSEEKLTKEVPATPPGENDFSRSQLGQNTVTVAPYQRSSSEQAKDKDPLNVVASDEKECNYAKGKWVPDEKRPLYSGFGCKRFLAEPWSCRLTHRKDFSFEKYRWQPEGCPMPEFNGHKFLKRMQHKTIAIVGDSLGRQQFQSLMCMVTGGKEYTVVEDIAGEYNIALSPGAARPDGWAYRFPRTNTTIMYYWSASLCEIEPINRTDPSTSFAMHLDRPAAFLQRYLDRFDILVLNTGHHWNRGKINANRWVMYAGGVPVTDRKQMQIWNAKNLTIRSVARWVDAQIEQRHPSLKAFFRTLSPRHFAGGDWNTGGKCDSTKPLSGGSEVMEDGSADTVTEAAVKGTRVKLLDITGFSQLRDEAHMSNSLNPKGGYDCLHWCLPGVPDTWNEILAARV